MAALASAVIVSAPQAKTYADTQTDDTQAVTEKLIDDQIANAAQSAEQSNTEKVNAEGKQNQQESLELKSEKEINSKKSGFGSQALNHPAQATELRNVDNESDNSVLTLSEEKQPEAQGAGETSDQKADDPNYGEDEKKIKDYDGSERYKQTDLQPGDTNQALGKTDEKVEKDGFKFELKNPSNTSPSKTEYGYEIVIDKKTGQRTYTRIDVTDSGKILVDAGNKPMMKDGDRLIPESPDVTYKPTESTEITKSGQQRNLNYEVSKETLEHINNKDNDSTSFGFKDNYTQDNPRPQFFGSNFLITYKVNPWPNENDKLELLKLNGQYNEKVFVQGQEIDTGIKVDNIDESAKERLVGQVYNPVTGKIVPGASAYIGENGNIHIKMPDGAINKDGSINKGSIFYKDPTFKGIQSLDVKFFARPRTADEFKAIADTGEDEYEKGTYVGTGAGTAEINHKGKTVTIDKQGIDRYDRYNLIGNFKLNLDDTKYYEQKFKDQNGKPTKDNVFSEVEPGKDFAINMQDKFGDDKDKYDKTPQDMKDAQERKEATAKANLQFFLENNKDKDGNLKPEEDRWKLSIGGKEVDLTKGEKEISVDDLSNLKITAPSSAKAGQFVAIPVEYTYTNGSKDIHWFHFVVKESDNNIPTYDSEAGIADKKLSKKPEISQSEKDLKKNQPVSYKLAKTEYKDDKGNVWNVTIDEKTGEVTATVPDNANIPEGGAKLNVDVEVKYEEEVVINGQKETRTYTESTKAQFYSIPSTKQEVKKEVESELPYKTRIEYDENIPAGKVVEEGGKVGKQKLVFSQIVVGNKKGALDENGKFVEGKESITTEVVEKAVDKVIKIGTKPATETVKIPRGLEYELDYNKTGDKPEVVEQGNDGEVTIKTTRDPQTGEITVTKTTTTEAKNKKIKIPAGTEGTHEYTEKKPFTYDVQFDPDFYKNYPDAKDNYKIVTEGKVGEKTTKWTIKNSQIVGEPEVIKDTDPTNAVIKVGQKDYTGIITHTENHEVPFEVEYKYSDELEAGQTKVEQKGEKGSYDVEYSQKIKNGEKDGELTSTKKNEKAAKKEIVVIGIKPVTKVVEKPFNTEYQYDENLESGKTEEVTPGKNGKVTITTTYDKDQKKVVTSETEEKGQNRVVKIGGKTNGTHTYTNKKPFEVEIKVNPELKKGEHKVIQKGVEGEEEFTVTIENSKVTKTSEPKETKAPVKEIIEVGSDDFTGTFETKKTKAVEFETEYIVDETLEPGKTVVDKEGKLGEEEITVTHTIVNGKVTKSEESKPVQTKAPEKRIVRVGKKPSEGETTKKIEREIPYETKVIYDENLEAGTQNIEKEGKPGKEEVTITQKIKDSKPVGEATETTKTITEKEDRVVRIGVKPVVKETELGHDTEYRHNPELKAGETKVIEEGSKGSVKYTTTFNKETGKLEVKEERTEPKNKVVEYGSKTEGEFKYESEKAYDIIVRENPDLEAGKTNVIQEGKPGKTETTVKIENSKEVSRDTKTITEKQDKIIEIGTKNVCEIPPVKPEDPTKPGKEDPTKPGKEDPTKPGDKDPEDPTKPGEKEPEKPGTPGENKPNKPGTPGENKPNEPGTPGEKPNEPGTPGEKPNEPGTPGEKPNEPGTPGETPEENGKTPENNGKTPENKGKTPENNGKTPENNGKTPDNSREDSPNKPNETPKTPETTEQVEGKEKADTPNRKSANKLPKAGSESEIMMLSMSALTTAAGFIGLKKKRKDR